MELLNTIKAKDTTTLINELNAMMDTVIDDYRPFDLTGAVIYDRFRMLSDDERRSYFNELDTTQVADSKWYKHFRNSYIH